MTTNEELAQLSAEIQKALKDKKEADATIAELREAKEKMAKDVADLQAAQRDRVERSGQPIPDYNGKAASDLVQATGIKGLKDVRSVSRFEDGTDREVLSKDAQDLLITGDYVHMADVWMGKIHGEAWREEKRQNGEAATFCKHFPSLGDRWSRYTSDLERVTTKATATTSTLANWIPTGMASNYLDDIRIMFPVIGLLRRVTMPTGPSWDWPILTTMPTAYIRTEAGSITQSEPGVGKRTFTAKTQAVNSKFTDEVAQDSIIAVLPTLRETQIRAMGEGMDAAIVNGDTSSPHIDSDYNAYAAATMQKAFNGMREFCVTNSLTDNTAGGSSFESTELRALIGKMGKYAVARPGEVALLVSTPAYVDLLGDSNILTMEKFGPSATIRTGTVMNVHGIDIYLDLAVEDRKDALDATGINTGSSVADVLGCVVIFNRNFWIIGDRRDVRFEQDHNIETGVNQLVVTQRWALQTAKAYASGVTHTYMGVNIAA